MTLQRIPDFMDLVLAVIDLVQLLLMDLIDDDDNNTEDVSKGFLLVNAAWKTYPRLASLASIFFTDLCTML